MPTFVTLIRFTSEGLKTIKDAPQRIANVNKNISDAGGKLIGAYNLLGRYDALLITEFPSERDALKVFLKSGATGAVTTETLTAVPRDEFLKVVGEI